VLNNTPQQPAIHSPMTEHPEQVNTLTRVCVDDLLFAFGLGKLRHARRPLELLFQIPARRLASQVAIYDRIVGDLGLRAGGAWALERMARRVEIEGQENVPTEGPLLLVANHPGLSDAVALFATIARTDLRVVAAERPFLNALPNTLPYLLTVNEKSPGRLGLVRSATRHLRNGGAVLTFPGGRIEPDPAVLPGAVRSLERWSSSAALFARLVPDLAIVPAIICGVLSTTAMRNPLTLLRHRNEDREWLAATLQIMTPGLYDVTVKVSFGRPIHAGDYSEGRVGQVVLERARRMIERCEAE
jgi:hypothetical protein